jgi:hypothetical protein
VVGEGSVGGSRGEVGVEVLLVVGVDDVGRWRRSGGIGVVVGSMNREVGCKGPLSRRGGRRCCCDQGVIHSPCCSLDHRQVWACLGIDPSFLEEEPAEEAFGGFRSCRLRGDQLPFDFVQDTVGARESCCHHVEHSLVILMRLESWTGLSSQRRWERWRVLDEKRPLH